MRQESIIFIVSIIIFCIALFIGARYVAYTTRTAREYKKKYEEQRKKTKQIVDKLQSSIVRKRKNDERNRKYNTELDDITKNARQDIEKISQIIEEGANRYNRCGCDCGSVDNSNNIIGGFSPQTTKEVKK